MQANLIMAGGPHMKAITSSDASGRWSLHISDEMKPCKSVSARAKGEKKKKDEACARERNC